MAELTGHGARASGRNLAVLPGGYRLHWYELEDVLGRGGFGITYLARDTNLNQRVAIKEFMPTDLAMRDSDNTIHPLSESHEETYAWGLSRFISEAQTLARFSHTNIVPVRSVFEANNSAYMVMDYVRGRSLNQALSAPSLAVEPQIRDLLFQLMDGVAYIHDAGFIHRDIKPDNVFVKDDGVPVLLDFGSARQTTGSRTRALTALVTPGYAPFEQYDTTPDSERQGPWTDIYSMGALLYRGIVGKAPPDALVRMTGIMDGEDPFEPARLVCAGRYSPEFLDAVDAALAFRPEHRPQTVYEWRDMFGDLEILENFTRLRLPPSRSETDATDDRTERIPTQEPEVETDRMTQTRGLPAGAGPGGGTGDLEERAARGARGLQVGQGDPQGGRQTRQLTRTAATASAAEAQTEIPTETAQRLGPPTGKKGFSGLAVGVGIIALLVVAASLIYVVGDPRLLFVTGTHDAAPSGTKPQLAALPGVLAYAPIRVADDFLQPQLEQLRELGEGYGEILKLDPQNADGRVGMKRLRHAYVDLSRFALANFGPRKSLEIVRLALRRVPGDSRLLSMQSVLQRKIGSGAISTADKSRIAQLTATARLQLQARRFVDPPDDNAAKTLRAIRALNFSDEFAAKTLRQMAGHFAAAARQAFADGDAIKGVTYLEQGLLSFPTSPLLQALRDDVQSRMKSPSN